MFVSQFQKFLVILYQSGETQIWLLINVLGAFHLGLMPIITTVYSVSKDNRQILYATSFCEHIWQCHCQCHSSRGQNLLVLILILQRPYLQKCELKQRKANGYDDVLVDFVLVWARLQEIFLAKVACSNFFLGVVLKLRLQEEVGR